MNTANLDIRDATHRDLPALIELYQHLVEGDEQPSLSMAEDVVERFKAYEGSAIVVAETAGVLVVSCAIVVVPNLTRGATPYGLIENVVTHHDFRKRGIGKRVLQRAVDLAWTADCYKVMLMTGSKERQILNFYLGAGFEQSKIGFQMRRVAGRYEK